jgi:hypothetical protein
VTLACLPALDIAYSKAILTLDVTYHEPLERAYKLAYEGHITASADQAQRWDVAGSSGGLYVVAHKPDGWVCSCPDATYRHRSCYHILGVQLWVRATHTATLQESPLAPQTPAEAEPSAFDETPETSHTPDAASSILSGFSGGCAAPLPEAPASANCHILLAGRQVQITLRDTDETRLLARLETLLQRFPVEATALVQAPTAPPPPVCPWHGRMKESTKAQGTWYCPGKMADGTYCQERWPAKGRA